SSYSYSLSQLHQYFLISDEGGDCNSEGSASPVLFISQMSAGTRIGSDVPFCEGALTEATSIEVSPAGPAPRFNAGSGASRPRCRKRRSARDVVLQRSS